ATNGDYAGAEPAHAAAAHSIQLDVVKLSEAKRGVVLLPRPWVVERSLAWMARFRRLARDYERLPETVAGLTFLAFACLMLPHAIRSPWSPSHSLERTGAGAATEEEKQQ